MDIIKGIVAREYNIYRDKSLERKNIKEDLKAIIVSFYEIWKNYSNLENICKQRRVLKSLRKQYRKDIEQQIQEIIEFYTASAKDLNTLLVDELRDVCSKFLILIKSTSGIRDDIWFEKVKNDGDKLCGEFDRIIKMRL